MLMGTKNHQKLMPCAQLRKTPQQVLFFWENYPNLDPNWDPQIIKNRLIFSRSSDGAYFLRYHGPERANRYPQGVIWEGSGTQNAPKIYKI